MTKTAKVSVSGVGLGLDPAGLGLGLPGLDNISGLGTSGSRLDGQGTSWNGYETTSRPAPLTAKHSFALIRVPVLYTLG